MLDISSRYFQGYCFPFSEKRLGLRLVVIDCNRTYIYFLSIDRILMMNLSVYVHVCCMTPPLIVHTELHKSSYPRWC